MGSRGACRSSCGRGAPATAKAPLPAVAAAPQAASCFVKTTRRSAPSASPGMLRHLEGSRFETTAGTSGTKTGRLTASPQDTATGKPTRQASLGASIRRGGPGVMNNTSGGGRAAPLSADQSLLRAASVAAQPESTEVWEARPGAARAPLAGYRRREPEHTILHAVVRERLESFLAAARERSANGRGLPSFVERDLRGYLDCGDGSLTPSGAFAAHPRPWLRPRPLPGLQLRTPRGLLLQGPHLSIVRCSAHGGRRGPPRPQRVPRSPRPTVGPRLCREPNY